MRKFLLPVIITFSFALSCGSADLYLRKGIVTAKPGKILIGYFERRNLRYDPYVVQNFRDAMAFEFFKQGYDCKVLKGEDLNAADEEAIAALCKAASCDVYIRGAISEQEMGDLVDRKYSTALSFRLYSGGGKVFW